jgi:hypothetical protein
MASDRHIALPRSAESMELFCRCSWAIPDPAEVRLCRHASVISREMLGAPPAAVPADDPCSAYGGPATGRRPPRKGPRSYQRGTRSTAAIRSYRRSYTTDSILLVTHRRFPRTLGACSSRAPRKTIARFSLNRAIVPTPAPRHRGSDGHPSQRSASRSLPVPNRRGRTTRNIARPTGEAVLPRRQLPASACRSSPGPTTCRTPTRCRTSGGPSCRSGLLNARLSDPHLSTQK